MLSQHNYCSCTVWIWAVQVLSYNFVANVFGIQGRFWTLKFKDLDARTSRDAFQVHHRRRQDIPRPVRLTPFIPLPLSVCCLSIPVLTPDAVLDLCGNMLWEVLVLEHTTRPGLVQREAFLSARCRCAHHQLWPCRSEQAQTLGVLGYDVTTDLSYHEFAHKTLYRISVCLGVRSRPGQMKLLTHRERANYVISGVRSQKCNLLFFAHDFESASLLNLA